MASSWLWLAGRLLNTFGPSNNSRVFVLALLSSEAFLQFLQLRLSAFERLHRLLGFVFSHPGRFLDHLGKLARVFQSDFRSSRQLLGKSGRLFVNRGLLFGALHLLTCLV